MLIAQLSDMHVRPPGKLFLGKVDSNAMLAAAVARVNKLDPAPDLVVLTGDLVEKSTDDVANLVWQARLAMIERRFDDARRLLEQVFELAQPSPPAVAAVQLAAALDALGEADRAEATLRQAAKDSI